MLDSHMRLVVTKLNNAEIRVFPSSQKVLLDSTAMTIILLHGCRCTCRVNSTALAVGLGKDSQVFVLSKWVERVHFLEQRSWDNRLWGNQMFYLGRSKFEMDFPEGSAGKESSCNAGATGDLHPSKYNQWNPWWISDLYNCSFFFFWLPHATGGV